MKLSEFHHLSVPGDGGCFFHSIVAILNVEKSGNVNYYNFRYKKGSMNLRKKCVSWLKKNLNYKVKGTGLSIRMEIEDAINNEAGEVNPKYSSVNGYLKFISDNDAYAGQIEIYAVSELLKRNIRVFTSKKKTPNAVLNNLGLGYDLFDAIMGAREVQAENLAKKCMEYNLPIVIVGKAYKPQVPYTNGSYSLLIGHYIEKAGRTLYTKMSIQVISHQKI